jgi:hypothetical protein
VDQETLKLVLEAHNAASPIIKQVRNDLLAAEKAATSLNKSLKIKASGASEVQRTMQGIKRQITEVIQAADRLHKALRVKATRDASIGSVFNGIRSEIKKTIQEADRLHKALNTKSSAKAFSNTDLAKFVKDLAAAAKNVRDLKASLRSNNLKLTFTFSYRGSKSMDKLIADLRAVNKLLAVTASRSAAATSGLNGLRGPRVNTGGGGGNGNRANKLFSAVGDVFGGAGEAIGGVGRVTGAIMGFGGTLMRVGDFALGFGKAVISGVVGTLQEVEKAAAVTTGVLTGLGVVTAKLGTDFNQFKENTLQTLAALTKSGEKAQKIFDFSFQLAIPAKFTFEEVLEGARTLEAFGISLDRHGQATGRYLTNAVALAQGMEKPLAQVTRFLGNLSQGRLLLQQAAPLGMGRQTLQQYGVEFDSHGSATDRTKLLEAAMKAIEDRWGSLLDKMANTYESKLDSMVSMTRMFSGKITEGLFGHLTKAYGNVADLFQNLIDPKAIVNGVEISVKQAEARVKTLKEELAGQKSMQQEYSGGSYSPQLRTETAEGIKSTEQELANATKTLSAVKAELGPVYSLVEALKTPFDLLGSAIEKATEALPGFVNWLSQVLTKDRIIDFLSEIIAVARVMWEDFQEFFNQASGGKGLVGIWENFRNFALDAIDAVMEAWTEFRANVEYAMKTAPELFAMLIEAAGQLKAALEAIVGLMVLNFGAQVASGIFQIVGGIGQMVVGVVRLVGLMRGGGGFLGALKQMLGLGGAAGGQTAAGGASGAAGAAASNGGRMAAAMAKMPKGLGPAGIVGALADWGTNLLPDNEGGWGKHGAAGAIGKIGGRAASMAATGAMVGSFFPGPGTVIGGVVGGVGGAIWGGIDFANGRKDYEERKRAATHKRGLTINDIKSAKQKWEESSNVQLQGMAGTAQGVGKWAIGQATGMAGDAIPERFKQWNAEREKYVAGQMDGAKGRAARRRERLGYRDKAKEFLNGLTGGEMEMPKDKKGDDISPSTIIGGGSQPGHGGFTYVGDMPKPQDQFRDPDVVSAQIESYESRFRGMTSNEQAIARQKLLPLYQEKMKGDREAVTAAQEEMANTINSSGQQKSEDETNKDKINYWKAIEKFWKSEAEVQEIQREAQDAIHNRLKEANEARMAAVQAQIELLPDSQQAAARQAQLVPYLAQQHRLVLNKLKTVQKGSLEESRLLEEEAKIRKQITETKNEAVDEAAKQAFEGPRRQFGTLKKLIGMMPKGSQKGAMQALLMPRIKAAMAGAQQERDPVKRQEKLLEVADMFSELKEAKKSGDPFSGMFDKAMAGERQGAIGRYQQMLMGRKNGRGQRIGKQKDIFAAMSPFAPGAGVGGGTAFSQDKFTQLIFQLPVNASEQQIADLIMKVMQDQMGPGR